MVIRYDNRGVLVLMEVSDTGIGIKMRQSSPRFWIRLSIYFSNAGNGSERGGFKGCLFCVGNLWWIWC